MRMFGSMLQEAMADAVESDLRYAEMSKEAYLHGSTRGLVTLAYLIPQACDC